MSASVRQRLLNRARNRREDFAWVLTRYGIERLLYRLGRSQYRSDFILKGAMLFPLWGIEGHRPTRDADLLGFGENTEAHLVEVFRALCELEVEDDGLIFDSQSVQAALIREEMEYGGIRVRLAATLGNARIPIQVDVGFGDAVTPGPDEVDYPTLLDLPGPHLRVYSRESVIAEKFQAMIHLGMANSRMKDFYDLWMLSRLFEFEGSTLAHAIERTFSRRHTAIPAETAVFMTDEFYADATKVTQWRAFLMRNALEEGESLETVVGAIETFLMPVSLELSAGGKFAAHWPMGGPWRR